MIASMVDCGWLTCCSVTGAPHFLKDLCGVSAGQARTIVVLDPEKAEVRVQ